MRAPGDWVPIPPHELATRCAWRDAGECLIFGGANHGSLLRLSELLQRLRELAGKLLSGKLRLGRAAGCDPRLGFPQDSRPLAPRGHNNVPPSPSRPPRPLPHAQASPPFTTAPPPL